MKILSEVGTSTADQDSRYIYKYRYNTYFKQK